MATGVPRGIATARRRNERGGFWPLSRLILGRDWPVAYLFAAPLLILLFGLIARPIYDAVRLSFYGSNDKFVWFENYIATWRTPSFRHMLGVTARFVAVSLIGQAALGTAAALLIVQARRQWRGPLVGILLLPWVLPEVVAGLAWRWFFDPLFGPLTLGLRALGLQRPEGPIVWLDANLAIYSIGFVNIWRGMPFFALVVLAGLQAIDSALYDAASVDGANAWHRFRYVTLPGLRYVLAVAALLSVLYSLSSFTLVRIMTNGGPGSATVIYPFYISGGVSGTMQIRLASGFALAPFLLLLIAAIGILLRGRDGLEPERRSPATRAWDAFLRAGGAAIGLPLRALDAIADGIARSVVALGARFAPRTLAGLIWRERLGSLGWFVLYGVFLLFALVPIYLILITAFKTNQQITGFRDPFWPTPWTLAQFKYVLTRTTFPNWFRNSVAIAAATSAISMLAATLGAYALARLRWRGAGAVATAILGTALVPQALFLFPLFLLIAKLKLINSPWALVVTHPVIQLPLACWLLLGFFRAIPEELEEAALIDGCSHFQTFVRIVLPLSWPAIAAVTLFTITLSWNELMFAGFFLRSEMYWTLPMGLALIGSGGVFPYGQIFAASILMVLPVALFAALGQRAMISGLTEGAVKG